MSEVIITSEIYGTIIPLFTQSEFWIVLVFITFAIITIDKFVFHMNITLPKAANVCGTHCKGIYKEGIEKVSNMLKKEGGKGLRRQETKYRGFAYAGETGHAPQIVNDLDVNKV